MVLPILFLSYLQPNEFFAGHIAGSLSFSVGGAGGTVVGAEDGNFAIWVK